MKDATASGKRLVILTREGLEHHYVANVLCAALPIAAIVVADPPRAVSRKRRRASPRRVVAKTARKAYRKLARDAEERRSSFVGILGEDVTGGFQRADLVRRVEGINSDESGRLVAELRPDLLLVYGTAIVADRILELASDLALNMHTGISPYYRGADTWFWPLVNRELQMIGATVHECTSAVDGGPIFKTARAQLQPSRNMYDLFAWSIVAGAKIYVEVVRAYLAGSRRGHPQELSLGREYRSAERTVAWERTARRLIRSGIVDEFVRAAAPAARTTDLGQL